MIGSKPFEVTGMQGNLAKKLASEKMAKGSDLSCYYPET